METSIFDLGGSEKIYYRIALALFANRSAMTNFAKEKVKAKGQVFYCYKKKCRQIKREETIVNSIRYKSHKVPDLIASCSLVK